MEVKDKVLFQKYVRPVTMYECTICDTVYSTETEADGCLQFHLKEGDINEQKR